MPLLPLLFHRRPYLAKLQCLALASLAIVAAAPASAQSIQITSPAPEQILTGPDVPVCFATSGIQFLPGGCNIHVMLDNGPFDVQYDPAHPHLFRDVSPGTHTIRAFAADRMQRAMPGTLAMVTFAVGYHDSPAENRQPAGEPILTPNLPQGEYLGVDSGDIALDFLVDGVCLDRNGYHVMYSVDGRQFYAYSEGARNLKRLAAGFHTVRYELMRHDGSVVPGPFNAVEKVILVSPEKTRRVYTEEELRRGLPRIDSIRGAMTNGQPWIAGVKAPLFAPQSATQQAAAAGLTVRQAGASAPIEPVPAEASGFSVRPGGHRAGPLPVEPSGGEMLAPAPVEGTALVNPRASAIPEAAPVSATTQERPPNEDTAGSAAADVSGAAVTGSTAARGAATSNTAPTTASVSLPASPEAYKARLGTTTTDQQTTTVRPPTVSLTATPSLLAPRQPAATPVTAAPSPAMPGPPTGLALSPGAVGRPAPDLIKTATTSTLGILPQISLRKH